MTTRGDQARPGATRDEFARETGRRHAFTTRRSLPPAPHLGGLSRVQELVARLGSFFGSFVQQVQKHLNSVGRNINEEGLYRLPGYHDVQGRPVGMFWANQQRIVTAEEMSSNQDPRLEPGTPGNLSKWDTADRLVDANIVASKVAVVTTVPTDDQEFVRFNSAADRDVEGAGVKTQTANLGGSDYQSYQPVSSTAGIYLLPGTSVSKVVIGNVAGGSTVGIGKVPTTALDVSGNIAVSGNLDAGGAVKLDTFLNLGAQTALTISGGVITATATFLQIDTEGAAASDDLDTINGGTEGDLVILKIANNTRAVVVKHGTGNIHLHGSADFTLDHRRDSLLLIHRNSLWETLAPGANNA